MYTIRGKGPGGTSDAGAGMSCDTSFRPVPTMDYKLFELDLSGERRQETGSMDRFKKNYRKDDSPQRYFIRPVVPGPVWDRTSCPEWKQMYL